MTWDRLGLRVRSLGFAHGYLPPVHHQRLAEPLYPFSPRWSQGIPLCVQSEVDSLHSPMLLSEVTSPE